MKDTWGLEPAGPWTEEAKVMELEIIAASLSHQWQTTPSSNRLFCSVHYAQVHESFCWLYYYGQ